MNEQKERRARSILFKLMFIISIVVVGTSAIFTLLLVRYRTEDLIDRADSKLLTAAELTREILGADYHDQIDDERSISREQFRQIVARNDDLCRRLNLQYLWSVLLVENRLVFTSATHSDLSNPDSTCASFFETHRDPESFRSAMQSGSKPSFSSFKNEWGEGRQVLIPFRDSRGRTYIFGASVQLTGLQALVRSTILNSIGIGVGVFSGAFLLALVLARSFTRPIARLTEAAGRMAMGDLTTPLASSGTLELQSLSSSLDRMRQGLLLHVEALRESEKAIKESEALLDATGQMARVGGWELDPVTEEVKWTKETYRIHEVPLDKRPMFEEAINFWYPDDRPVLIYAIQRAIEHAEPFDLELRFVSASGRNLFARVLCKPIVENGKTVKLQGTFQDVTERRIVEDEFAAIFNMSLAMICIADITTSTFTRINPAFTRILGYDEKELLDRPFLDFIHLEDVLPTQQVVEQCLRRGEKVPAFENRYRHKDGSYRWLMWNSHPRPEMGCTYAVAIDITEHKKAEEARDKMEAQLLQAQKMEAVGRLAGGVAHDFNNMLSIIIGQAEMLLDEIAPGDPYHHEVMEIKKAGKRSSDLTRQLLAFARKQTISPKVLDINETASGILKMLQRLIGEDINLVWLPGVDVWPVKVDPSQIDQILANLAVNARDAISGVGTMTIETSNVVFDETYCETHSGFSPGNYVLLAVSDTGGGMSKETLDRIFEPFFTTKELGKGTGLGLATVYGIVKQNNGFINVYSEPAHGTAFKIYLPRAEEPAAEQSAQVVKKDLNGTETVLLVEDEQSILALGKSILEQRGYTVLAAQAPEQALKIARSHPGPIHLLITDVVMPGMNGKDLRDKLEAIAPGFKCLFVSGYTANVIAHHGVLDEGIQFLQKPFSVRTLVEKVRKVLDSCVKDHG